MILAGINLAVAAGLYLDWPRLPDWAALFPFLQLIWSLPLILVVTLRGRTETARGMVRAIVLTLLVSYGWWIWLANNTGFD